MNIELKQIAESKVRQLGGDVCGVLVRNEAGAWAAVSEGGRVMWLDDFEGQAASAQGGQGAEAIGVIAHTSDPRGDNPKAFVKWLFGGDETNLPNGTELYTQPQPAQQGSLPEVCDGKEQKAFEVYASRKGYDMAQHPIHYLFINDKTNAARQAWKAAISYCHEKMSTPQPEGGVPETSDIEKLRCQQCGNMEPFHATGCKTEFGSYSATRPQPQGDGWIAVPRGAVEYLKDQWPGAYARFYEKVDELKRPQPPKEGE